MRSCPACSTSCAASRPRLLGFGPVENSFEAMGQTKRKRRESGQSHSAATRTRRICPTHQEVQRPLPFSPLRRAATSLQRRSKWLRRSLTTKTPCPVRRRTPPATTRSVRSTARGQHFPRLDQQDMVKACVAVAASSPRAAARMASIANSAILPTRSGRARRREPRRSRPRSGAEPRGASRLHHRLYPTRLAPFPLGRRLQVLQVGILSESNSRSCWSRLPCRCRSWVCREHTPPSP